MFNIFINSFCSSTVGIVIYHADSAQNLQISINSVKKQSVEAKIVVISDAVSVNNLQQILTENVIHQFIRNHKYMGSIKSFGIGVQKLETTHVMYMDAGDQFYNNDAISTLLTMSEDQEAEIVQGKHVLLTDGKYDNQPFGSPVSTKILSKRTSPIALIKSPLLYAKMFDCSFVKESFKLFDDISENIQTNDHVFLSAVMALSVNRYITVMDQVYTHQFIPQSNQRSFLIVAKLMHLFKNNNEIIDLLQSNYQEQMKSEPKDRKEGCQWLDKFDLTKYQTFFNLKCLSLTAQELNNLKQNQNIKNCSKPQISIIVVNQNKNLKETLKSVFFQLNEEMEVLVVADQLEELEQYKKYNLKIIPHQNFNLLKQVQVGIFHSIGKNVVILQSGDQFTTVEAVDYLLENSEYDIVHFGSVGESQSVTQNMEITQNIMSTVPLLKQNMNNMMYKRKLFKNFFKIDAHNQTFGAKVLLSLVQPQSYKSTSETLIQNKINSEKEIEDELLQINTIMQINKDFGIQQLFEFKQNFKIDDYKMQICDVHVTHKLDLYITSALYLTEKCANHVKKNLTVVILVDQPFEYLQFKVDNVLSQGAIPLLVSKNFTLQKDYQSEIMLFTNLQKLISAVKTEFFVVIKAVNELPNQIYQMKQNFFYDTNMFSLEGKVLRKRDVYNSLSTEYGAFDQYLTLKNLQANSDIKIGVYQKAITTKFEEIASKQTFEDLAHLTNNEQVDAEDFKQFTQTIQQLSKQEITEICRLLQNPKVQQIFQDCHK